MMIKFGFNKDEWRMGLAIFMMTIAFTHAVAAVVDIPTQKGQYISWNNATGSGFTVENEGANVGSTGKNTVCNFSINNSKQQDYTFTFAIGSKAEAKMLVTLKSATATVVNKNIDIPNTGSWTPTEVHEFFLEQLPAGSYTLTFRVTQASGYAGNWGNLAFYEGDVVEHVPGIISVASGTYGGGARTENNDTNVGYIVAGSSAHYKFKCDEPGAYQIQTQLQRYNNGGTMHIKVTDDESGNTEVDGNYVIASNAPGSYTNTTITMPGEMTTGRKTMTFTFSGGDSYICNYKDLTLKKVAEHYAGITSVSIDGQEVTIGTNTDWNCNVPKSYQQPTVKFSLTRNYGSVKVTARNGSTTLDVEDLGSDTYSIATPAYNEAVTVSIDVTPDADAVTAKQRYTLRIFHMGDPLLVKKTLSSMTGKNSCIVTLTFDRPMQEAEATVHGADDNEVQHCIAEGGKSALTFPVWDLQWNSTYTFQLTKALDLDGNAPAEPVSMNINVGSKPACEQRVYDYVVGSTDELLSAVAAVNKQGGTRRKTILVKNGTYVMPVTSTTITAQNVSIIGQSREGVILLGTNKEDAASSAIIKAEGNGLYMQDLTLRTSHWRTGEFFGRVLAMWATGEKLLMKRVELEGQQDTYLCGHRGYHEDCIICGTVDFIYSGGDNFFHQCDIVIENRGGNVITAPATSPSQRWGMVFDSCTIKRAPGASLVTDGSYNLGRPWHNEPRTYYLNTIMEVKPSATGWASMSDVPTHFYEYNSMDKNGKPLDLSKRGNSPTSTNHYTPVLTDSEARFYTRRNVMAGSDAWDAPAYTRQLPPPAGLTLNEGTLNWQPVEDARCYVVTKDGEYIGTTTDTSFTIETSAASAVYAVQTANQMGGIGDKAVVQTETAIGTAVRGQSDVVDTRYYNIMGMEKKTFSSHPFIIRVDTLSDGRRKVTKRM